MFPNSKSEAKSSSHRYEEKYNDSDHQRGRWSGVRSFKNIKLFSHIRSLLGRTSTFLFDRRKDRFFVEKARIVLVGLVPLIVLIILGILFFAFEVDYLVLLGEKQFYHDRLELYVDLAHRLREESVLRTIGLIKEQDATVYDLFNKNNNDKFFSVEGSSSASTSSPSDAQRIDRIHRANRATAEALHAFLDGGKFTEADHDRVLAAYNYYASSGNEMMSIVETGTLPGGSSSSNTSSNVSILPSRKSVYCDDDFENDYFFESDCSALNNNAFVGGGRLGIANSSSSVFPAPQPLITPNSSLANKAVASLRSGRAARLLVSETRIITFALSASMRRIYDNSSHRFKHSIRLYLAQAVSNTHAMMTARLMTLINPPLRVPARTEGNNNTNNSNNSSTNNNRTNSSRLRYDDPDTTMKSTTHAFDSLGVSTKQLELLESFTLSLFSTRIPSYMYSTEKAKGASSPKPTANAAAGKDADNDNFKQTYLRANRNSEEDFFEWAKGESADTHRAASKHKNVKIKDQFVLPSRLLFRDDGVSSDGASSSSSSSPRSKLSDASPYTAVDTFEWARTFLRGSLNVSFRTTAAEARTPKYVAVQRGLAAIFDPTLAELKTLTDYLASEMSEALPAQGRKSAINNIVFVLVSIAVSIIALALQWGLLRKFIMRTAAARRILRAFSDARLNQKLISLYKPIFTGLLLDVDLPAPTNEVDRVFHKCAAAMASVVRPLLPQALFGAFVPPAVAAGGSGLFASSSSFPPSNTFGTSGGGLRSRGERQSRRHLHTLHDCTFSTYDGDTMSMTCNNKTFGGGASSFSADARSPFTDFQTHPSICHYQKSLPVSFISPNDGPAQTGNESGIIVNNMNENDCEVGYEEESLLLLPTKREAEAKAKVEASLLPYPPIAMLPLRTGAETTTVRCAVLTIGLSSEALRWTDPNYTEELASEMKKYEQPRYYVFDAKSSTYVPTTAAASGYAHTDGSNNNNIPSNSKSQRKGGGGVSSIQNKNTQNNKKNPPNNNNNINHSATTNPTNEAAATATLSFSNRFSNRIADKSSSTTSIIPRLFAAIYRKAWTISQEINENDLGVSFDESEANTASSSSLAAGESPLTAGAIAVNISPKKNTLKSLKKQQSKKKDISSSSPSSSTFPPSHSQGARGVGVGTMNPLCSSSSKFAETAIRSPPLTSVSSPRSALQIGRVGKTISGVGEALSGKEKEKKSEDDGRQKKKDFFSDEEAHVVGARIMAEMTTVLSVVSKVVNNYRGIVHSVEIGGAAVAASPTAAGRGGGGAITCIFGLNSTDEATRLAKEYSESSRRARLRRRRAELKALKKRSSSYSANPKGKPQHRQERDDGKNFFNAALRGGGAVNEGGDGNNLYSSSSEDEDDCDDDLDENEEEEYGYKDDGDGSDDAFSGFPHFISPTHAALAAASAISNHFTKIGFSKRMSVTTGPMIASLIRVESHKKQLVLTGSHFGLGQAMVAILEAAESFFDRRLNSNNNGSSPSSTRPTAATCPSPSRCMWSLSDILIDEETFSEISRAQKRTTKPIAMVSTIGLSPSGGLVEEKIFDISNNNNKNTATKTVDVRYSSFTPAAIADANTSRVAALGGGERNFVGQQVTDSPLSLQQQTDVNPHMNSERHHHHHHLVVSGGEGEGEEINDHMLVGIHQRTHDPAAAALNRALATNSSGTQHQTSVSFSGVSSGGAGLVSHRIMNTASDNNNNVNGVQHQHHHFSIHNTTAAHMVSSSPSYYSRLQDNAPYIYENNNNNNQNHNNNKKAPSKSRNANVIDTNNGGRGVEFACDVNATADLTAALIAKQQREGRGLGATHFDGFPRVTIYAYGYSHSPSPSPPPSAQTASMQTQQHLSRYQREAQNPASDEQQQQQQELTKDLAQQQWKLYNEAFLLYRSGGRGDVFLSLDAFTKYRAMFPGDLHALWMVEKVLANHLRRRQIHYGIPY